ncbi:hypothetical protein BAUCODRAFT_24065 [Baudoinia panamericana UAMH 10762]|uniref:Uncharacterized protein n=1 Tax=Baudoinia panamericana (strain UAMH 10762) TaxID=717646 RepID=M2NBH7_BAUPA|nr:uncharacterized protein BAUCODRAFT_24065 [Baudoinia panamericana UAMH 10762]EMC96255.1 hypothetical protein BAUCODRAFT_24065 [Baudoinia panamericana UAMH 10762]
MFPPTAAEATRECTSTRTVTIAAGCGTVGALTTATSYPLNTAKLISVTSSAATAVAIAIAIASTSATTSPVTSGTTGLAAVPCNMTGANSNLAYTSTANSSKNYTFAIECFADYPNHIAAFDGNNMVFDV